LICPSLARQTREVTAAGDPKRFGRPLGLGVGA